MTKHQRAIKALNLIMAELHYDVPTDLTLNDDPVTGERNAALYTDGVVYDYLHNFDVEVNEKLESSFGFWLENYGQGIYTISE